MGSCPPLGIRLQKFLATYLMLLPEEEKGMFQFHHYPFLNQPNKKYGFIFHIACKHLLLFFYITISPCGSGASREQRGLQRL